MKEERQTKFTIMEGCTLPSGGQIYDKPVDPTIELRAMTARDEMKRLNPSTTPLKTLADIIEDCCVEKPAVHVYDMAFGDYEFLLHKLRIITYGPDYKIGVVCPECGEYIETVAKLDQLTVKSFDSVEFENLKTFTLPVSSQSITLKIQTPRIIDSISNKAKEYKRKTKNADINFETYVQLLMFIDKIDDRKVSQSDIEYFIEELSARDMNVIMNKIDKLNNYLGIDNSLDVECSKCGETIETFFRFGPEFFRPSLD